MVKESVLDCQFDIVNFGQVFQMINCGVIWVGFFFQVVQYLMIVVWMYWDQVFFVFCFMMVFFFNNCFYYFVYINVIVQVCCFVEGFWVIFMYGGVQMGEVNMWIELFDYINQIVVSMYVVGIGVYGKIVCYVVYGINYLLYIFNGGNNVWQVEDWVWWIVWVNSYMYVDFFSNWNNCFQEDGKVFVQFCFVDIFVQFQVFMELVEGVVFFCVWKISNDVMGQMCFVFIVYSGEVFSCLSNFFFGVICFCVWVFQDMYFECSEFDLVEVQSFGVVWQYVFEVSMGLVEYWYEVVVYGVNVILCQVVQSLLIVSDLLFIVVSVGFDIFVNWYVFYDRLYQVCVFNDCFVFEDLFNGLYFVVWDMVQCGNYVSCVCLMDIS